MKKILLVAILGVLINTGCMHLEEYAGSNLYENSIINQDDDPMWGGDVDPMDWWCCHCEMKGVVMKRFLLIWFLPPPLATSFMQFKENTFNSL